MAFNGTGTFSLASTSVAPAVSGTTIESSDFNTTTADIVSGLNKAYCRDGQSNPTANLPMAGYKFTGVGNATLVNDFAAAGQVQNGSFVYAASSAGTDAYAITLTPSITAYAAGQAFRVLADVANTGACSLNVNSLGAVAIKTQDGADPANNVILATSLFEVVYDGTNFVLMSPAGGAMVGSLTGNVTGTTVTGTTVNASTTLQIGGVAVTSSAAELNYNDITTLGTAQASKTVTADANIDVTGLRNLTITGTGVIPAATVTTINSRAATPRRVLISTADLSSTPSTIDFILTTDYTSFEVLINSLTPVTDNVALMLRYSTDGGSTYIASLYNYDRNGVPATAQSSIVIADGVSNVSTEGAVSGSFRIHGMTLTQYKISEGMLAAAPAGSPNQPVNYTFAGLNTTGTGSVDAIRLLFSGGAIVNRGSVQLFGIS